MNKNDELLVDQLAKLQSQIKATTNTAKKAKKILYALIVSIIEAENVSVKVKLFKVTWPDKTHSIVVAENVEKAYEYIKIASSSNEQCEGSSIKEISLRKLIGLLIEEGVPDPQTLKGPEPSDEETDEYLDSIDIDHTEGIFSLFQSRPE